MDESDDEPTIATHRDLSDAKSLKSPAKRGAGFELSSFTRKKEPEANKHNSAAVIADGS